MKSKLIAFVFLSLALTYLIERNMAHIEGKLIKKTIMDIIQNIISDPEFLALDPNRQLRVLIMVYNLLDKHFMAKVGIKKRYVDMNQ